MDGCLDWTINPHVGRGRRSRCEADGEARSNVAWKSYLSMTVVMAYGSGGGRLFHDGSTEQPMAAVAGSPCAWIWDRQTDRRKK